MPHFIKSLLLINKRVITIAKYISKKVKCSFTNAFKKQMGMLCQNSKKQTAIVSESGLTHFILDRWIKQYQTKGEFIHSRKS
jgi:transposase-like protein